VSEDSPSKPRDALIYILERLGDEVRSNTDKVDALVSADKVDALVSAQAVAAEARATQRKQLADLRTEVARLATAIELRTAIDKDRDAKVQRQETAAEAVAAARWGAFGRLANTIQDCFKNPVVVAVGAGLASPLAISAAYLLARWLGIPVQALLTGHAP